MNLFRSILVIKLLILCNCSPVSTWGEFQEDIPGGGQAIVKYEIKNDEVVQIIQSTESTKHFIESTFSYLRGELSSVSIVISEFVYNDEFVITDARKVADLRWEVGEPGLVLKKGQLDERLVSKNQDFLAEGKRLKKLVVQRKESNIVDQSLK